MHDCCRRQYVEKAKVVCFGFDCSLREAHSAWLDANAVNPETRIQAHAWLTRESEK
jgi:hypothetical protein